MPELTFFPTTADLPPPLKQQILDFLRIHYPDGFQGANQWRDWTSTPENHPAHLVLTEQNRLISHTEIVWKYLEHNGVRYKAAGLSGVLTYPEFRRQGYGAQIVAAGTAYIKRSDADLGMFHCDPTLKAFYVPAGWQSMETAVTLIGDRTNPEISDELLMMLFLTPLAETYQHDFATIPFYFGETTW